MAVDVTGTFLTIATFIILKHVSMSFVCLHVCFLVTSLVLLQNQCLHVDSHLLFSLLLFCFCCFHDNALCKLTVFNEHNSGAYQSSNMYKTAVH